MGLDNANGCLADRNRIESAMLANQMHCTVRELPSAFIYMLDAAKTLRRNSPAVQFEMSAFIYLETQDVQISDLDAKEHRILRKLCTIERRCCRQNRN